MQMSAVWMEVDLDNKELPVRIADTAGELARLCGCSARNIRAAACHAQAGIERRRFIRVLVEDDEC